MRILKTLNRENNKKINFALYAFLVWSITQISLQVLLIFCAISLSTLLSQLIYLILGYKFYSQKVFQNKKNSYEKLLKFLVMSIFLWFVNTKGIHLLDMYIHNKNISAVFMIPILAFLSFQIQKYLVFKDY
tara:strand:+ start:183 stop:575 length:393 start_codon:yes stop_codon:yes gene_type:complete